MEFISYHYFFKVHIYFLWYYRFLMAVHVFNNMMSFPMPVRVFVPIVNSEKSLLRLSLFTCMILLALVIRYWASSLSLFPLPLRVFK